MADSDSAILYAMQIKQAVVRVTNVIWILFIIRKLVLALINVSNELND